MLLRDNSRDVALERNDVLYAIAMKSFAFIGILRFSLIFLRIFHSLVSDLGMLKSLLRWCCGAHLWIISYLRR